MIEFLQQVINGLSVGFVYALLALGYTMVYGILRFINFAHSDVFMVGAFCGFYFGRLVPAHSIGGGLLVILMAMLVCAALGIVIERLAYRPLRSGSNLAVLITAIGVSLLLENAGQLVFGADPKFFPELFPTKVFVSPGGLRVSSNQLLVFVVTAVLMVALQWIVLRTRIGTAMRAVSFNAQAASLVGINIDLYLWARIGPGGGGRHFVLAELSVHRSLHGHPARLEGVRGRRSWGHRKYSRGGPGRHFARFD
jgi:branched-chain amino acid transport system permease protein